MGYYSQHRVKVEGASLEELRLLLITHTEFEADQLEEAHGWILVAPDWNGGLGPKWVTCIHDLKYVLSLLPAGVVLTVERYGEYGPYSGEPGFELGDSFRWSRVRGRGWYQKTQLEWVRPSEIVVQWRKGEAG